MKITVNYPTIMKFQASSEIEVSNEEKLDGIREKIFEDIWNYLNRYHSSIRKHGSPKDIVLYGDVKICNDSQLQDSIQRNQSFNAVFGNARLHENTVRDE